MRFVIFCHSLLSDWNHGNAHFLRGISDELIRRGHRVDVYEPIEGWSLENLRHRQGSDAIRGFFDAYPRLHPCFYHPDTIDLDAALDDADVVLVHEWNDPDLVQRIGRHRARFPHFRLLFHDTHHRLTTRPEEREKYDLSYYDGVLAFGRVIRDAYLQSGHAARAWVWHEAADPRVFRPRNRRRREGELVWIGNWGDEERTEELQTFLLEPSQRLGLTGRVHGVRYPDEGIRALQHAGLEYGGWLPNYRVPDAFARFAVTVHVPRRPYRETIDGIPTIRVFEALACGIPLVCVGWDDSDGLFTPGRDYLVANTGRQMTEALRAVLNDPELAGSLADHGRRTILARHTCAHRVDELFEILRELDEVSVPAIPHRPIEIGSIDGPGPHIRSGSRDEPAPWKERNGLR
jgi:spore maturation protein CgeB